MNYSNDLIRLLIIPKEIIKKVKPKQFIMDRYELIIDHFYICPYCETKIKVGFDMEKYGGYFNFCESCNTTFGFDNYRNSTVTVKVLDKNE